MAAFGVWLSLFSSTWPQVSHLRHVLVTGWERWGRKAEQTHLILFLQSSTPAPQEGLPASHRCHHIPVLSSNSIPFLKVQPHVGEAEMKELGCTTVVSVTASSRPPVWPLAEQTIPNSQCRDTAANQKYSWPGQGKPREQWSHHSLCRRASIPFQRQWQCAPRAHQVQAATKPAPCRVLLASEAALCTSRLAQRDNWQGEKEGTYGIGPPGITLFPAPWGNAPPPGADLAHGNFSPKVKYYLEANDKQNLFLQWSCLKHFSLIPLK